MYEKTYVQVLAVIPCDTLVPSRFTELTSYINNEVDFVNPWFMIWQKYPMLCESSGFQSLQRCIFIHCDIRKFVVLLGTYYTWDYQCFNEYVNIKSTDILSVLIHAPLLISFMTV